MNRRRKIPGYFVVIIALLAALPLSCKKDDEDRHPTNGRTTAVFNDALTYGTMTDQEGNIYRTITIGTQTWMAENLRTTIYRNGDPVPVAETNGAWQTAKAQSSGACCVYGNIKNNDTIATFGRLYNVYAALDRRNLAPEGWHVATHADWSKLYISLGTNSGVKSKEAGNLHWLNNSPPSTNESGFTALPAGNRGPDGLYSGIGTSGFFVTPDLASAGYSYFWLLSNTQSTLNPSPFPYGPGGSVRCVRD
jgi:uncharacterized protein (TIGR02145 family)